MKRPYFLALAILALGGALLCYGHGMNHAGPHGGEIRMPGIFHTEVLWDEAKEVRAYLLDGEIQHAVTERSKVSAFIKREAQKLEMKCEAKKDYFGCRPASGVELKPGDKVVIEANRQGQSGVAIYTFPFKYSGNRAISSVGK
jgi:hypothetical protein